MGRTTNPEVVWNVCDLVGVTAIKSDCCMSLILLGRLVRHKCTEISNLDANFKELDFSGDLISEGINGVCIVV